MNSVDEIVKLVKEKGFDGVKLVDHAAIREAGPLIFDKESLTKKGKKTLVVALDDAFKHLYTFTNSRQASERHIETFEDTNKELANLSYESKGFAQINEDKGFARIETSDENNPSRLDLLSESFKKTAQELNDAFPDKFEAICVEKHNLANLKSIQIPSDVWHDIGLSSLKVLPKGFTDITTNLPNFIKEAEEKQAEHLITHIKTKDEIDELRNIVKTVEKNRKLDPQDLSQLVNKEFLPNEIVFLNLFGDEHHLRFDPKQEKIIYFNYKDKLNEIFLKKKEGFHGIQPMNKYQKAQFELLLNSDITYFYGAAGTGKSLIPLALGVHALTHDIKAHVGKANKKTAREDFMKKFFSEYNPTTAAPTYDQTKLIDNITILVPTEPVGKDIGYLPGSKDAKMAEHSMHIYKNLEFILSTASKSKEKDSDKLIIFKGLLDIEPHTYLRGRTLRGYNIVEEGQNVRKDVLTTVLTRYGDDSKTVIIGDPAQTDIPGQEIYYNSLTRHLKEIARNPTSDQGILFLPNYSNVRGRRSRYHLK